MIQYATLETYAAAPDGYTVVYVDGSSTGTSEGPAGWAWYVNDDHWACGGFVRGTNNMAEIAAIQHAALSLPLDRPLAVVSDSQYALGAVFKWYDGWVRDGWRTGAGEPVKNSDLIAAAHQAIWNRTALTLIKHVRGHGKDPNVLPEDLHGNRLADMLAVEAKQRTAATGEPETFTSFDLQIVHGRGRRKRPFTEPA